MLFAALLAATPALERRVDRVLARTPVIDGHNDLPWELRERFGGRMGAIDLRHDTAGLPRKPDQAPLMTDIPRLRAGHVGAQFWSVWIPATDAGPHGVVTTLEQIDTVKRMAARYPDTFAMAYRAADVVRIEKAGRIASLIGIEGGHQFDDSLAVLRQLYAAGARYMTLAHSTTNAVADSATDAPRHGGLSPFGRAVVGEMNRMGMLVDLSHVSAGAMRAALAVTTAPVIFSHSGARAVTDHPRDVPDDVLALVKANRGVVMVNFYPPFVDQARRSWEAERDGAKARAHTLATGDPAGEARRVSAWDAAHPRPVTGIGAVADHVEHIARVCGHGCVGIGGDFDGIPDAPEGLDGVDGYPRLFIELARRRWSDGDLAALAGGNILRVMREAETIAVRLQRETPPGEATTAADRAR